MPLALRVDILIACNLFSYDICLISGISLVARAWIFPSLFISFIRDGNHNWIQYCKWIIKGNHNFFISLLKLSFNVFLVIFLCILLTSYFCSQVGLACQVDQYLSPVLPLKSIIIPQLINSSQSTTLNDLFHTIPPSLPRPSSRSSSIWCSHSSLLCNSILVHSF